MVNIVDRDGNPIKLSRYQKDSLYKQAKGMRENITRNMCTRTEAWKPTRENVEKMRIREFGVSKQREHYKKCMQAIGADPKDQNTERLRPKG